MYALIAEHSTASKECFLLCLWYFQKCKFIHYDYLTNTVTLYANNWSERKNMAYQRYPSRYTILCVCRIVPVHAIHWFALRRTLCVYVLLYLPIYKLYLCHTASIRACNLCGATVGCVVVVCTLEMSNNGQNERTNEQTQRALATSLATNVCSP